MPAAVKRAETIPLRSAAAPAVRLRGVGKMFNDFRALEGIDLDFPRGELTTLLGPSGCGKTTTLKIVAGLLEATEGEVLVNGQPVTGPGPERAFVFQDFALLPWGDGPAQRRLRPRAAPCGEGGARGGRPQVHRRGRSRRRRAQISARAVRRHAPARRPRPGARGRRRDPAHGRAVRLGRRAEPAQVPGGSPEPAGAREEDRHLRHPLDRGGGLHLRPGRRS